MKFKTILILFLIFGVLFVSACTTGNAPSNPPPSSGGGCGVNFNPVKPLVSVCDTSSNIKEVPVK